VNRWRKVKTIKAVSRQNSTEMSFRRGIKAKSSYSLRRNVLKKGNKD